MVAQRQVVAEVDSNGAPVSTTSQLDHPAVDRSAEANIDHQLAQNAQDRFLAENVKKFLLEQSSRGGGGGAR